MPAPGYALLEAARVPHARAETVRALRSVDPDLRLRRARARLPFLLKLPLLFLPKPPPEVLGQEGRHVRDGRATCRDLQFGDEQFGKFTPAFSLSRCRLPAGNLPCGLAKLSDEKGESLIIISFFYSSLKRSLRLYVTLCVFNR